jgi:5'-3' exonuclease
LISDTVIVYKPRKRTFITKDNAVNEIGIIPENIVLEKVICGDVSDNIKGVKGVGNETLIKYFPQLKTEKMDLRAIIERSKFLLEERKQQKKRLKGERKEKIKNVTHIKGKYCSCKILIVSWVRFEIHFLL